MMLKSANPNPNPNPNPYPNPNPNPNPYDIYPSLILLMMICNLVEGNGAMNQKHDVFFIYYEEVGYGYIKNIE